ncbi:MAG: mandelate racemase/muconate lactonizing enzyme family protein [Chloroflexi bacterium]|nr:mandelate racemase/muconate lactonizing enzyme family protein [Chloroflexota bacterium]
MTQELTSLEESRAEDGRGLRIRSVEPFSLLVPTKPASTVWTFCRIRTEEGLVGLGEGIGTPGPVCAAIRHFGNSLIGQSAWDIEKLWVGLYRASEFSRSGVNQAAISAIDIALWDLVGQKTGLPVYALLGGRVHDRVPIYHHPWDDVEDAEAFAEGRMRRGYVEATRGLVAQGILAGKLDPFPREPGYGREISPFALRHATDIIAQIREGGGPDYRICVEMHARFNVASALRIARALAPLDPFWIEEPVAPESLPEAREVQRATELPVATGERLFQRVDFRDALEQRCCRIIQPDVAHVGGITEMKKIGAMADAYYVTVAPHEWNGPVTLLAGAHVGSTLPNLLMCEYHIQLKGVLEDTMPGGYRYDPRFLDLPATPGIGVAFSEAYIREHRFDPDDYGRPGYAGHIRFR